MRILLFVFFSIVFSNRILLSEIKDLPTEDTTMNSCISIIIPVFNEEKNIPILYDELMEVIAQLKQKYTYELIFVNDGSYDNSWDIITTLLQQDKHIKAIKFSRNFGHQAALTAGYDYASGDAIISMDADMQDPPSLLIPMIKQWEDGADIVYARRVKRNDSFLKRITANWYYAFFSHISDITMPRNVGDFRLLDKKVLKYLQQCRECSRYLRGMVAWTGFKHAYIDFERPNRLAGQTGYTWKKMIRLATDGMTGFSFFPLKIAAYSGCIILFFGILLGLYLIIMKFIYHIVYSLSTWLAVCIVMILGMQCLLLWLVGEYIGRIYDQTKGRPLYIIDEKVQRP